MKRKGTMIEETINSEYLKEDLALKIYYPEAFSPMNEFHLCIMQDGNDYIQLGRVATFSDHLHEEADIDDTVFVGIHYKDRYDRRKKYHPTGEQQHDYVHFLVYEVVPTLNQLLPNQMLLSRALMGDSLAGTLALMTAIKYPNTFHKVIMQSPLVDDTVLQAVHTSNDIHSITIYHTIGTAETDVETLVESNVDFLTPNRHLQKLLREKCDTYHYKELPDGKHTWKYWQNDMQNALKTMFNDS